MATDLSVVDTIVVVMMENRSFDHALGYLSLSPWNRKNVEGLRGDADTQKQYSNVFNNALFKPFEWANWNQDFAADPPHDRTSIATQLGPPQNGVFPMNGFVTSYATATNGIVDDKPPVMSYCTSKEVPILHFLAQNYAICDHWFSSIPASTQPNRLMAMSGVSNIDDNVHVLEVQSLVYDWLNERRIRWRVYHEGLPFFTMMVPWVQEIVSETGHFRHFDQLAEDIRNEPDDEFPQVIFVEPTYTDAPHHGMSSDDHAPSAISNGQQFLLKVYTALTQIPQRWGRMVMIITYDEHGGIFDHVTPPLLPTEPPPGKDYPRFESLGVRVPGIIVTPLVERETVFTATLDHTSILKFIGQKFGQGGKYSADVDNRPVGSVADVLNRIVPRDDIPAAPNLVGYVQGPPVGYIPECQPQTPIQFAFKSALDQIADYHEVQALKKFDWLKRFFT